VNVFSTFPSAPGLRLAVAFGLAALAVAAYLPAQLLPLIGDDYIQVHLGRKYGPVSSWPDLAADALYRCRATSIVITYWTEQLFGFAPAAFKATSVLVHVLNVLLVAALGLWRPIGWRLSVAAAAFFAIAEGHQEAVIWYAALPELLVFTFVIASFILWVRWIQADGGSPVYLFGSLALFIAALLSKESAVCLVALQALAILINGGRRLSHWIGLIPFGVLSAAYFAAAYVAKSTHLHFNDGTFVLSAPFWVTLPSSIGRMFWISGAIALMVLALCRKPSWRLVAIAAVWMTATLLPYSFLSYMPRVPSRHTYLASVALAWVIGAALLAARERWPGYPRATAVLAIGLGIQNCGYIWTKKQRQYSERAAPTHDLVKFSKSTTGPILVKCFEYGTEVAELAVRIGAGEQPGRLRWARPAVCDGHAFEAVAATDESGPIAALTDDSGSSKADR
jgi:hypothetical protein